VNRGTITGEAGKKAAKEIAKETAHTAAKEIAAGAAR
jgi:hypothetical protein